MIDSRYPSIKESIMLILIVSLAFFLRVYELPTKLFIGETHQVFQGIRLHTLEFFNFSDHMSENFFKSFFGAMSGLRHVLSVYISSGIYEFFNIPINEFWLRFFYVFLGTISVALTYTLGCMLFNNRLFGIAGAFIMAINPGQISASRIDNAEATITLTVMITLLLLLHYQNKPSALRRTAFSLPLVLIASMESIILLPLFVLFQLMLFSRPKVGLSNKIFGYIRYLLSKDNILIWLPTILIILVHYYVYTRIGDSNVGLFGYAINLSHPKQILAIEGGPLMLNILKYSEYYFNSIFFIGSIFSFFFLIFYKLINKAIDDIRPLIFLGVGFFYFFLLIFVGIGSTYPYFYIHDSFSLLFLSSIWVYLIIILNQRWEELMQWIASILQLISRNKKKTITVTLILFISLQVINSFTSVLSRQQVIHPLKSIGYYINENSDKDPAVYIMMKCTMETLLRNVEFYLGTQMMGEEVYKGKPRKQFCMGSKSVKETLEIYELDDFDFYISIYAISEPSKDENGEPLYKNFRTPEIESQIKEILANGLKRVAVIKNDEIILGEIFSHKKLPFIEMDINKYDKLWDKEYANIAGIIKTNWSGQTSIWGYMYDIQTGVKRGIE